MPKFYVERFTLQGWIACTAGIDSLTVVENMKKTLAKRYNEDVDNFSIVVREGN